MNNDIMTMIELQKYWDKVLASRASIEKAMAAIKAGEKELAVIKNKYASLGNSIKELKTTLKQHELDLSEMSNRIKKLEDRKRIIQTERELKALEKEIDVLKFDSASLEEKTLGIIDELDQKEKDYENMGREVQIKEESLNNERDKAAVESRHFEGIIKTNEDSFNATIGNLSIAHRSKFLKIIGSRDGKAIARVEGEICGFCNRKIPASLAIDASKEDKIVNCSNCGKYIYR